MLKGGLERTLSIPTGSTTGAEDMKESVMELMASSLSRLDMRAAAQLKVLG